MNLYVEKLIKMAKVPIMNSELALQMKLYQQCIYIDMNNEEGTSKRKQVYTIYWKQMKYYMNGLRNKKRP